MKRLLRYVWIKRFSMSRLRENITDNLACDSLPVTRSHQVLAGRRGFSYLV